MFNGIFRVPEPKNEPVLSYAPGSWEKAALKARLKEMLGTEAEVPMIIGGEEVRNGNLADIRCPHERGHLLGRYHKADAEYAIKAVDAAQKAKKDWGRMPWESRAVILLKAADLLAGKMGIVNVDGRGVLFINDSDMWALPVVGKILKFVGFEKLGMVGMSDAQVSFGISSGVITIKRGHMSNKLSAVEVEPGGTADISSGQVDMGVIVLVVKGVDEVLRAIPVVNWFSAMKDKLSRLRVKGHWSEPMGELIRKEPVRDVKDGTLAFFESVIKSGGQLSESMFGTLGSVLNGNGKGEKKGGDSVDGGKIGD